MIDQVSAPHRFWVCNQFACSIGSSSSFLLSFQGLVIFIKDLLTHIEFDCFVLEKNKNKTKLLNLKQRSSKDSLVESSQVFLTPLGPTTPIELLLESQVFVGCTPHFFCLWKFHNNKCHEMVRIKCGSGMDYESHYLRTFQLLLTLHTFEEFFHTRIQ